MEKCPMNIILDMDQTLIFEVHRRPYLDVFLEICFLKFQNVSIWTAASQEWFDYVNENTFTPILKEISDKYLRSFKFDFVFTRNRCSLVKDSESIFTDVFFIEKRLNKLFKSKEKYKDYTKDNTIVLDDDAFTFRKNYGNALRIFPYFGNTGPVDDELICAAIYIIKVVIPHFKKERSVRNLDKRGWRRYV
jgi:hypothetical protein